MLYSVDLNPRIHLHALDYLRCVRRSCTEWGRDSLEWAGRADPGIAGEVQVYFKRVSYASLQC